MIEQNQAYKLEFQNFRRVHRNRAVGELFAIELEVSEDDWHHLSDFPQDALGEVALCWTERAEAPPKREAKPKEPTPYGLFWKAVRLSSIPDRVELHDWLGLSRFSTREDNAVELPRPDDVWKALRKKFNTESLSFVSPETAIAAFEQANLPGVAAIARRLAGQQGSGL